MLPVIIFSLILLSANLVVSKSLFEDGLENLISRPCYDEVLAIFKEKKIDFKDLFAGINEGNNLDAEIARGLPDYCFQEIKDLLTMEKKILDNVFIRNGRSVDLLDKVPHPIVDEWKKLQSIIAEELPEQCLENLEDILNKNKKYFKHLFIGMPRSTRSAEFQEMIDSLFGIPKHFCNFFSNGWFISLVM